MSPRGSLFVKGSTIKLFYLSKICGECMGLLTLFKAQKTVIALFQYLYRVFSCRQSSRFTIMEDAFVLSITIMKDIFCKLKQKRGNYS